MVARRASRGGVSCLAWKVGFSLSAEDGEEGRERTEGEEDFSEETEAKGKGTELRDEDEEEEGEEEEEAYAYDDENDNELAASLFDLKTGTSIDDEDGEEFYFDEEALRAGSVRGEADSGGEEDVTESQSYDEDEWEEGGRGEYDNEYLDPSDWRSLQLLAETEEGKSGEGDLDFMAESDDLGFARDVLMEMQDRFLAENFLNEANEQHWAVQEQQASQAVLPQFGTSTRRKRKAKKKDSSAEESVDNDFGEDEKDDQPVAVDLVHPARVTGTSEWYPETSERCLYYHETLKACALEGRGDDAVVCLEEMRVAGILPGPKAYHAAVHAYSKGGDLVGAVNVVRKAFEMMVPAPLESTLVVTRMAVLSEEAGFGEFDNLLGAWKWLGYDTDKIANEAIVTMLRAASGERVDEVLGLFGDRKDGSIQWKVNENGLLVLLQSLCEQRRERRAAELLQFELGKEELGLLGELHFEPLIRASLDRGELGEGVYQLKVCLLIASPYLDFKKGLIGLFHTVLEAGGDLGELDRLRDQHCVVADQKWQELLEGSCPEPEPSLL
ncbi:hypothetical protein HOP50_16g78920 [Chloropicon primus]|nr:hypothetical protein HOP50_16g78920 [Chloropicon primus]